MRAPTVLRPTVWKEAFHTNDVNRLLSLACDLDAHCCGDRADRPESTPGFVPKNVAGAVDALHALLERLLPQSMQSDGRAGKRAKTKARNALYRLAYRMCQLSETAWDRNDRCKTTRGALLLCGTERARRKRPKYQPQLGESFHDVTSRTIDKVVDHLSEPGVTAEAIEAYFDSAIDRDAWRASRRGRKRRTFFPDGGVEPAVATDTHDLSIDPLRVPIDTERSLRGAAEMASDVLDLSPWLGADHPVAVQGRARGDLRKRLNRWFGLSEHLANDIRQGADRERWSGADKRVRLENLERAWMGEYARSEELEGWFEPEEVRPADKTVRNRREQHLRRFRQAFKAAAEYGHDVARDAHSRGLLSGRDGRLLFPWSGHRRNTAL